MRGRDEQAYLGEMKVSALVAATVFVLGTAPTADASARPVNEGNDDRPCVTYEEFTAWHLGAPMRRVARMFDTNGHRAGRRILEGALDAVGAPALTRGSQVRVYQACADPETGALGDRVVIEFNMHSRRHRAISGAWS